MLSILLEKCRHYIKSITLLFLNDIKRFCNIPGCQDRQADAEDDGHGDDIRPGQQDD